ncbi:hypothetical protein BT69DRAFT_547104 [Atractiella rhizophila]|nr:hypothetical protein BT69DRAFT_547104 [Atractiella rhizophila]
MAYDKTRTANSVPDPASQSKYLTLLNTLSSEMSLAKQRHAALMGLRRTEVVVEVARVLGGVGESEWRRTCEGIRKGGKEIGGVVEWTTYCGLGVGKMSGIVASDFSEKDKERERRDEKKEKESTVTFADPPSSRRDSTIRPLPSQPKSPPLPSAIKQNTMTSPTPEPSPSLSTQTQPQKSTTPTSPSERPQAGNPKPVANQADSAPLATVAEEKTASWGSPREGRTYGSTTSPPQPQPSSQRTSGQFSPRLPSNPDIPNLLQKPDQDRPLPLSSSPKMVDDGQLPPQYSPGMMKFPLREKEGFADSNNASTSGSGSNTSSNIVPPTPRDEDGRPRFEKGEIDSLLRKGFTMEEIEDGDDRQSLVSPILGKNKFWSDLPNPAPPIQHQQRIPPHQHQQQQRPLPTPQPQPQPDRRMSTYEGDLPPMPMPQPIPQTSRRHTMDPYSMSQSGFSQGSYGMSHSQHGGGGQGIGRAGGRVERTLSIESTDSSRSFVAEMKRRYAAEKDSRNSQPHPQGNNYRRVSSPPIPIPSNHGGRVADLASRYTATPPLDQSYPSSTTSSRHMMPTHQSRHSTSVLPPPGSLGLRSSPRPSDSYSRDRDDRRLNYPEENEYVDRNRRYSNSNLQQQRNLESLVVEEQERERYGGGGGGSGSRPGSRPPSAQDRQHPPNCGCFRCMKEYGVSGSPRGSPGMGPSAGGDLREFGTLDGGRERPEERYYGDERYGSNMSSSGGGHRRE